MKILVIAANGMLGHKLFCYLSNNSLYDVYATVRSKNTLSPNTYEISNLVDIDSVNKIISYIKPDVILNCAGFIKQNLHNLKFTDECFLINSYFPHHLAEIATNNNIRLINFSTDCVFRGLKGCYTELDTPDAIDIYGLSKRFGEIIDSNLVLTIRTSIIGHELNTKKSLLEWFLSQENTIAGYTKAIFTGLPTIELAKIIDRHILNNVNMHGLMHIASSPISKFDLLSLISVKYNKKIRIIPTSNPSIDRSLDANKFNSISGYSPPDWINLVDEMYLDFVENYF